MPATIGEGLAQTLEKNPPVVDFQNQGEVEIMEMLLTFIVGWFGSVWWPGIEVDAPPPKGDPWWWRLLLGVVGGVSAIAVARLVPGMDAMVGLVVMIAAGRVGSGIVASVAGAVGR